MLSEKVMGINGTYGSPPSGKPDEALRAPAGAMTEG